VNEAVRPEHEGNGAIRSIAGGMPTVDSKLKCLRRASMSAENSRPGNRFEKWQTPLRHSDSISLNRHPRRPHLFHLVIPILYLGTGTCYALGDLVSPIAIAASYYMISIAHCIICFAESDL
jgi:hypothetical protein